MFVEKLTSDQINELARKVKMRLAEEVKCDWKEIISRPFADKAVLTFFCGNSEWDTSIMIKDYGVDVTKSRLLDQGEILSIYTHMMKDLFGQEYEEKFLNNMRNKLFR